MEPKQRKVQKSVLVSNTLKHVCSRLEVQATEQTTKISCKRGAKVGSEEEGEVKCKEQKVGSCLVVSLSSTVSSKGVESFSQD